MLSTSKLLHILLCILSFLSMANVASFNPTSFISPPSPPSSASFSLALSLLANMLKSQIKNSKDVFETCPQLWSNQNAAHQQEKQSIFGSADEILNLCPTANSNNSNQPFSTSICQGAMGITGYVCKAIKSADYPISQPLIPIMLDLDKISRVESLCEALGDVPFQESLCKIVETRLMVQPAFTVLQKPLDDICNKIPHQGFSKLCVESCSGSINQRGCNIILQGLRTIIHLETLKENAVSNVDGDSDTAIRSDAIKASEKTDVKQNFSRSETGPLLHTLLPNNSLQSVPMPSSAIGDSPSPEKPSTIKKLENVASYKDNITSEKSAVETVTPILGGQLKSTNVQPAVSPSNISTLKQENIDNVTVKKDNNFLNFTTTKTPTGQNTVVLPKTTTNVETVAEDELPEPLEPEDDLIIDDETQKAEADPNLDEEDNAEKDLDKPVEVQNTIQDKPSKPDQSYDSQSEIDEDPTNTHFLFYFMFFVFISVTCYIVYQRRNRIIAFVIEGRSGQSSRRRGSSSTRERPSSGSYRKLNNLEDAISSQSIKNSNVIY